MEKGMMIKELILNVQCLLQKWIHFKLLSWQVWNDRLGSSGSDQGVASAWQQVQRDKWWQRGAHRGEMQGLYSLFSDSITMWSDRENCSMLTCKHAKSIPLNNKHINFYTTPTQSNACSCLLPTNQPSNNMLSVVKSLLTFTTWYAPAGLSHLGIKLIKESTLVLASLKLPMNLTAVLRGLLSWQHSFPGGLSKRHHYKLQKPAHKGTIYGSFVGLSGNILHLKSGLGKGPMWTCEGYGSTEPR